MKISLVIKHFKLEIRGETMKTFTENLANLIKVKTLITLTIIAGVTYGFIVGMVQAETYSAFAGSIVTYYFTKKEEPKGEIYVKEFEV
jgi:hypothetical protein